MLRGAVVCRCIFVFVLGSFWPILFYLYVRLVWNDWCLTGIGDERAIDCIFVSLFAIKDHPYCTQMRPGICFFSFLQPHPNFLIIFCSLNWMDLWIRLFCDLFWSIEACGTTHNWQIDLKCFYIERRSLVKSTLPSLRMQNDIILICSWCVLGSGHVQYSGGKVQTSSSFCQPFVPSSKDINTRWAPKMMSNRKEGARIRNPNKQNPVSCLHPNNKLQFLDIFGTLSRCSHSIAK